MKLPPCQSAGRPSPSAFTIRDVAALCISGRSIYKHLPGVLAYDVGRDAFSFKGGMPVVAHPPCRCWSRFLSNQAKPPDRFREMSLGRWCVEKVIENGGVLEHPAHSGLFEVLGLPTPNRQRVDPFLFSIEVRQADFGFPTEKRTWLLIAGVPISSMPPMPTLPATPRLFGTCQKPGLSQAGRSRTMQPFAEWLCQVARASWWSVGGGR